MADSSVFVLALVLFVIMTIAWYFLQLFNNIDSLLPHKYVWGSLYQIIALIGGLYGIVQSKKWGGSKSTLGRSILFFSLGLIFQCVGQTVYSYYNLFAHIEAPYPSLGDVGYFGSVIWYIAGALSLAHVAGVRVSLKSFASKFQALLIPLVLLGASYYIFLQGYEFDWTNKLKIFLDFGYPLGQAFYVSVAVLTLVLSRKFLGGLLRLPIVLFIVALIVQYLSDFNFLFQVNRGNWFVGGAGDLLYMVAYLCMTVSIIFINQTFRHIQDTSLDA